jgi:hypothetical protein
VAEKTCTPGLVKIAVGTYYGPKTGRFEVAKVALIPKAPGAATISAARTIATLPPLVRVE